MTTLMRWVLGVVWLAGVGWLWHVGALGTGSALVSSALTLVPFLWHGAPSRRRRSALRYVEMGKQPVGLP